MKRRAILQGAAAAASLAAAPLLRAQRAARVHRVGVVMGLGPESADARRFLQAFNDAMRQHGYEDGRNFLLTVRYYGDDRSRVPALADELLKWEADVLVANVSSTAVALRKKTSTVPIVMVTAVDAVGEGLAASLARPGGNVTGMTSPGTAMYAKLIELARELNPFARRIALLANPDHALSPAYIAAAAQAAKALAVEMTVLEIRGAGDVEKLGDRLAASRADALVVATDAVLFGLREPIVRAATKARLPTVAYLPEFIASGAVATLGFDLLGNYRAAARYVDRILKGAKAADLPIEQPTQMELTVNVRAAKALGLRIPQSILVRADRLIE